MNLLKNKMGMRVLTLALCAVLGGSVLAVKAESVAGETVVQDGKLLTGEAAGSAFDLGLAMLKVLKGTKTADEVRVSVCYRG